MLDENKSDFWNRIMDPWWGKVAIGLFMLGGAILLYTRLAALEAGEFDSMRVSRFVKIAYDIGGKYTASGLTGIFGIGFAGWGAVQAIRGKE